MKTIHFALAFAAVVSLSTASNRAYADTFGTAPNEFTIEFVEIGNPSNLADTGMRWPMIDGFRAGLFYAARTGAFSASSGER